MKSGDAETREVCSKAGYCSILKLTSMICPHFGHFTVAAQGGFGGVSRCSRMTKRGPTPALQKGQAVAYWLRRLRARPDMSDEAVVSLLTASIRSPNTTPKSLRLRRGRSHTAEKLSSGDLVESQFEPRHRGE